MSEMNETEERVARAIEKVIDDLRDRVGLDDMARAAIAAMPQGEPVAWRARYKGTSTWVISGIKPANPRLDIQPLYAAPAQPVAEAGVREALEPFAKYEMVVIGDPFSLKRGDLKDCDYVVGFVGPVQPEFRHFAAAKAALTSPSNGEEASELRHPQTNGEG